MRRSHSETCLLNKIFKLKIQISHFTGNIFYWMLLINSFFSHQNPNSALASLASLSILNYELYSIIRQLLYKTFLDCGVMFAMPNAVAGTNVLIL